MSNSELVIKIIRDYCANLDDLAKIATAVEALQEELQEKQEEKLEISHVSQLTQFEEDVEYAERMRAEYPDAEGLNY